MRPLRALIQILRGPRRRSSVAQAALDRAVAAVDRELAANLELTSMFDQTHQPFVLEMSEFMTHRGVLEREVPAEAARAGVLYERIPETEAAMERRGPANSLKDADRAIVEAWEGDARELQRTLRAAASAPAASRAAVLRAWLRGG